MNHNTLNLLIENSNKNNKSNAENKNSPFKDIKMESNEFFNFFSVSAVWSISGITLFLSTGIAWIIFAIILMDSLL